MKNKCTKTNKIFACILAAALLLSTLCISVSAADKAPVFTAGDYQYSVLDDGTAQIEKYTGKEKELSIPTELDGKKVTAIGGYSFEDCSFTSLTIPEGITTIGDNAFRYCKNMTTLSMPKTLTTIKSGSFSFCEKLDNVSIPDSVTNIGNFAFQSCKALKNIKISNSIDTINDFTFTGCEGLTTIDIPSSIKILGQNSFAHCYGLKNVVIPEGITLINTSAFSYCENLTSVSLPNTLETVNAFAFCTCLNLKEVTVPDSVTEITNMAFGYRWDNDKWNYLKVDGFVLKGYTGSAADRYAQEYGVNFESIGISQQPQPSTVEPTTGKPIDPGSSITVYFKNTKGFSNVYAYYWPKGGHGPIDWPGTAMTLYKDDVYVITVPAENNMIIFSDKGASQIGDLDIPGNNYIYDGSSWSMYGDPATEPTTDATETTVPEPTTNPSTEPSTSEPITEPTDESTVATTEPISTTVYVPETTAPVPTTTEFVPATTESVPATTKPGYIMGDLNMDGDVDITDVTLVQESVVEKTILSEEQRTLADMNGDGIIDIKDATEIQMFIVKH